MLGGGLGTSWELVLASGVWRGWVADSFSCFFKKIVCIALRDFSFLQMGRSWGYCGAFFPWGVLRGRVVCLQLRLHVLGGRWRWWRFWRRGRRKKGKLVFGAAGGWLGPLGSTFQDGGSLRKMESRKEWGV